MKFAISPCLLQSIDSNEEIKLDKRYNEKDKNVPFNKQLINMPIMFSELIQKTQKLFLNINLGEQYSWENDGSKVIIIYIINI